MEHNNCQRHVPEQSGAVLDTTTGLREWFDSYDEAIRIAAARNVAARTAAVLALALHAPHPLTTQTHDALWPGRRNF
jgi:hypothetical protein